MSEMKTKHGRNHKEAFCVMTYRCKDCGFEERIWNSRDGVTPFGLGCPNCGGHNHMHDDWHLDQYSPLHSFQLKPGNRYFISMTMERARIYAALNVDAAIAAGRLPENTRNRVIAEAAKNYFQNGEAPDIAIKV